VKRIGPMADRRCLMRTADAGGRLRAHETLSHSRQHWRTAI